MIWDGIPKDPEKDGPHFVLLHGDTEPIVILWYSRPRTWTDLGGAGWGPAAYGDAARYLGPVPTPAETERDKTALSRIFLLAENNDSPAFVRLEIAGRLARAAIDGRDVSGWSPIASAPRDGSRVDLWLSPYSGTPRRIPDMWWVNSAEYLPGYWRPDARPRDRIILRGDGEKGTSRYTHWRPVPLPPGN